MNTNSKTEVSLWDKLWNTINSGLILIDSEGKVCLWNDWVAAHSGIPAEFAIGHPLESLFQNGLNSAFKAAIRNALSYKLPIILSNALHRSPLPLYPLPLSNDVQARLEQSISLTPIMVDANVYCLLQICDTSVSVRRERVLHLQAERLSKDATTDSLTGLYNRRFFDDRFKAEFARAQRQNAPLSVVMLDVDYFKRYNDTYGHSGGDHVLIAIAKALGSQASRATDVVARYGGEEFIVILPDCIPEGAQAIAKRLREAVANLNIPHIESDVADHVTISVGAISLQNSFTQLAEDFLRKDDQALYEAKHAGRNCIRHLVV